MKEKLVNSNLYRGILIDVLDGYTVCPRRSGPFYIVSYYIKWGTTTWTHTVILLAALVMAFELNECSMELRRVSFSP